jgi:hypothetical protein
MTKQKPVLTVAQALVVIDLQTRAVEALEKTVGIHALEKDADIAKEQKRETLFEAIQSVKHDLKVLKGNVQLQDPEVLKSYIDQGLISPDTKIPEVDLHAEKFTYQVTIAIPNAHQFNRGLQVVSRVDGIPSGYWAMQKKNLPLLNKLSDPTLTQAQLDVAFEEHFDRETKSVVPVR